MKTPLLLTVILLTLSASILRAQNTWNTAKWFNNNGSYYPSTGTVAPDGPDYGCAETKKSPLWYLLATCARVPANTTFNMSFYESSYAKSYWSPDTISMVVWGPFDDTTDVFNHLTSANIATCLNMYFSIFGGGSPMWYIKLESGKFYYMAFMNSDSVKSLTFDLYTDGIPVQYSDSNICSICNGHVTYTPQRICLVTIDSATGKNKIVWSPEDSDTKAYIIYRQGSSEGKFDSIGRVESNEPKEFIDGTSIPLQKSYTYTLGTVDSCERIQPYNPYNYFNHPNTTIHLTTSVGLNGEVNLVWNPYGGYYSDNYQTYSTYYIFRNVNYGPYEIIDSIAANTTTFTDLAPPSGPLNYRIGIRVPSCYQDQNAFTYSNRSSATATGMGNIALPADVKVFPNPAHDNITLELGSLTGKVQSIRLLSVSGDVVRFPIVPLGNSVSLKTTDLPVGIYILEINSNGIIYRMKVGVM